MELTLPIRQTFEAQERIEVGHIYCHHNLGFGVEARGELRISCKF